MKKSYTAVIKQEGRWWIGWVEEIPGMNCRESSREELVESLKNTMLKPSPSRLAKPNSGFRNRNYIIKSFK